MTDCIFCKIVQGAIPCTKVYEDEDFLAFLDINPINPGHTLLIPKAHFATLEDCPASIISVMASMFPVLARAAVSAVKADGYNIFINNGRAAGQLVDHVHFHILPRFAEDGAIRHSPAKKLSSQEMNQIAAQINSFL